MKTLHFYINNALEIDLKVTDTFGIYPTHILDEKRTKILQKDAKKLVDPLCAFDHTRESLHPGVHNYSLEGFPNRDEIESEIYKIGAEYYLLRAYGELSLVNQYGFLPEKKIYDTIENLLKREGIQHIVKPNGSSYSRRIPDYIINLFEKSFDKVVGSVFAESKIPAIDFFISSDNIYCLDNMQEKFKKSVLPEFHKKEYEEFINNQYLVTKYRKNYGLNKYLAKKYSFNHPSIYLIKLYKDLEIDEYQSVQYESRPLGKVYDEIKDYLQRSPYYYRKDELEAKKNIFSIPEEKELINLEFNKLILGSQIGYYMKAKADYPELLGQLKLA